MERPQKIGGGEIAFVDVACLTAGNEIAAGIVAELRTWDDMIEAAGCGNEAAQAIKAAAAFSDMNRAAQRLMFQPVEIVERLCARDRRLKRYVSRQQRRCRGMEEQRLGERRRGGTRPSRRDSLNRPSHASSADSICTSACAALSAAPPYIPEWRSRSPVRSSTWK